MAIFEMKPRVLPLAIIGNGGWVVGGEEVCYTAKLFVDASGR